MSAQRVIRYVMCACLLAYLYSCAASLPKNVDDNAPDAEVTLGPVFKVSDVPVKKFSAVSDDGGQIHILAVSNRPKNLHYLTINKGAVNNLKIIDANGFLENLSWIDFGQGWFNLDVALDHKGRFHAIIGSDPNPYVDYDRHHLIFEQGEWQELSKVRCEKIDRCGDDLICAFRTAKQDLSRFGGGDTGLKKLVVAQDFENGWSDWTVFDYVIPVSTQNFSITADEIGNFYIIYSRSHGHVNDAELAYAQIQTSESSDRKHGFNIQKKPTSVSGMGILRHLVWWRNFDIAIDADSLNGMIASGEGYYLNISDRLKVSEPIQFIEGGFRAIQIAPAGNGRFHAIVYGEEDFGSLCKIAYIQYHKNKWSKSIELGETDLAHPRHIKSTFDIISSGSGNAIAVWINKNDYLVGQWIKMKM